MLRNNILSTRALIFSIILLITAFKLGVYTHSISSKTYFIVLAVCVFVAMLNNFKLKLSALVKVFAVLLAVFSASCIIDEAGSIFNKQVFHSSKWGINDTIGAGIAIATAIGVAIFYGLKNQYTKLTKLDVFNLLFVLYLTFLLPYMRNHPSYEVFKDLDALFWFSWAVFVTVNLVIHKQIANLFAALLLFTMTLNYLFRELTGNNQHLQYANFVVSLVVLMIAVIGIRYYTSRVAKARTTGMVHAIACVIVRLSKMYFKGMGEAVKSAYQDGYSSIED